MKIKLRLTGKWKSISLYTKKSEYIIRLWNFKIDKFSSI